MTSSPAASQEGKQESSVSTTQTQKVKELIQQLKEACRRPLFDEIVRHELSPYPRSIGASSESRKSKRFKPNPRKSWQELLADASKLAPTMTLQEFGMVSRAAAILLLGFLVPSSTGNDFFVNVGRSKNAEQHTSESVSDVDTFINMPLEERLERSCRFYAQGEFGEVNCLVDTTRERAFHSFLRDGIGPLLAARPAHSTETDLLHILAMAISPQPQQEFIAETITGLVEKDSSSWTHTKQLMACIHPRSFQVNASHRLELVEMLASELVLPHCTAAVADDALQEGAVPHLRAALHSFAVGESAAEAHEALVSIAVQTGDETTVSEEWDALLKLTVNDCTECNCSDGGNETAETKPFCAHEARGELLEQFVLNFNESRHYADTTFTHKALESLSKCIQESLEKSPYLLASLLVTARSLFYFLLADTTTDEQEYKSSLDVLIRSCIQLLHHPNTRVSRAASSLLALVFSYNPIELTMANAQGVEKSIQMALAPCFRNEEKDSADDHFGSLQDVIITISRIIPSFASSMLDYLLTKLQQDDQMNAAACRMIATISSARPFAAQKHVDSILALLKISNDANCKSQLVAALLMLRQAHLFAKDAREDARVAATKAISDFSEGWIKYKLACQALVTGNYLISKTTFDSLLAVSSSEESFLWLSVLSNVATAESELESNGFDGVLTATPPLYSAISYLESLTTVSGREFGFQNDYLQLRIDFLEQCASLYGLCREIRLSGVVPRASVRTGLHLRNSIKLFYALAGRYYSLYKRYGLFLSQQSRTALRTNHAICRWLGDAVRKAFPEVKTIKGEDDTAWPHGDQLHPSIILLKKLSKMVIGSMDGSLDPQLRAAAIAETLDAVLMTPCPFPRGFTSIKSVPSSTLKLSVERNESGGSVEEIIGVYPGATITIVATGEIPREAIEKAEVPFSQVLLWPTNRYIGPLSNADDEVLSEGGMGNEDSQGDSSVTDLTTPSEPSPGPQATPLLPSDRYLAQLQYHAPIAEGLYSIEVVLGCRDVRCGEWELPVERNSLMVRVSRSRA